VTQALNLPEFFSGPPGPKVSRVPGRTRGVLTELSNDDFKKERKMGVLEKENWKEKRASHDRPNLASQGRTLVYRTRQEGKVRGKKAANDLQALDAA